MIRTPAELGSAMKQAGLDPTPACPLCNEVLRSNPQWKVPWRLPEWKEFYDGYVCGACTGRFADRRWMAFIVDMVAIGYAWALLELPLKILFPMPGQTADAA